MAMMRNIGEVLWIDFRPNIMIRIEKSDETKQNLMITVHKDTDLDYYARLDVEDRDVTG